MLSQHQFVRRVEVREQQANCYRLDRLRLADAPDLANDLLYRVSRKRQYRLAPGVNPFAGSDAPAAPHERLRLAPVKIVLALSIDALNEGHVLKSARRHQDDGRALTLNDGVRGHCRAVRDPFDVTLVPGEATLVDHAHESVDRRAGRRRVFGHHHAAVLADSHEVSEGAPGIDADPIHHAISQPCCDPLESGRPPDARSISE